MKREGGGVQLKHSVGRVWRFLGTTHSEVWIYHIEDNNLILKQLLISLVQSKSVVDLEP